MLALLQNLFVPTPSPAVQEAYIALVARARNPFFYTTLGVPDTLDGRFELIVLHLFLLQHRLLGEADDFSREMSELFFSDMDRSLRELGIADTGVRYRIKAMAKAYHGRLQAYGAALHKAESLRAALARNLYGTVEEGNIAALAQAAEYLQSMARQLAAVSTDMLTSSQFQWPAITIK